MPRMGIWDGGLEVPRNPLEIGTIRGEEDNCLTGLTSKESAPGEWENPITDGGTCSSCVSFTEGKGKKFVPLDVYSDIEQKMKRIP